MDLVITGKETITDNLCVLILIKHLIVTISRLRGSFSVGSTGITQYVSTNFSLILFLAERLSFSEEAKAMIEKITELTATEKETIMNAMWVSIEHIIVIIPQLIGSPLVRTRER